MSRRSFPFLIAAAGLALSGCDLLGLGGGAAPKGEENASASATPAAAQADPRLQRACASDATYDRLKELVFDEAARARSGESALLDQLATASIVRMERPVVRSRDENLNITLCSGHFILELPPGAENAFGGQRRLTADVQYSAQAAADGSGLVYNIEGAEPIVERLAMAGGGTRMAGGQAPPPVPQAEPPQQPAQAEPEPQPQPQARRQPQPVPIPTPPLRRRVETAEAPPPRRPAPTPAPAPRRAPAPQQEEPSQQPRATAARPSFNCAAGRSRSERMVCANPGLAALDRQMSSRFYSALANADPRARARLRESRNRFLSFRERCGSEACVAQAYRDRMDEIADISRGR